MLLDESSGIDLPSAKPDEKMLLEEKNIAKYSKTKEFGKIKKHFEERIAFYQSYLPDGKEIGLDVQPTPEDWRVANRIIGEFKLIINFYETATEAVDRAVKNESK